FPGKRQGGRGDGDHDAGGRWVAVRHRLLGHRPRRRRPVSGPLEGVRVLDFTALVQGPMATQMLGDLGADVIKIEKVGGEWMRFWGILNGKSHGEMDSFLAFNRNKRSAEADLRDPQIRDRMLELAADADVVVE